MKSKKPKTLIRIEDGDGTSSIYVVSDPVSIAAQRFHAEIMRIAPSTRRIVFDFSRDDLDAHS